MTLLADSTPAWPAISDDTGDGQSGTEVDETLFAAIEDSIEGLIHSTTNPGVPPNTITDEVVTARGSKASLGTRLNVSLTAEGLLAVGGGTTLKYLASAAVSVNPGSIAANTRGTVTFTLAGAAAGDVVVLAPPSGLNAGLLFCGCYVSGANTVTIVLYNATGSPIDDGALNWSYLWFDLT